MSDDLKEFLRARLAAYEFPAAVCGDRMVLKLTVEQAMQVIDGVLNCDDGSWR